MKQICKHCIHSCKKEPAPECDKFAAFSYEDAKKERKELLVSKKDNNRLKELEMRLTHINGGTL